MCVSLKVQDVAEYTEELMKVNRLLLPKSSLEIAGFDKITGACTIQIIDSLGISHFLVSWPFVERDEYPQPNQDWVFAQKIAYLLSELGFSVVMYELDSLFAETQAGLSKIQIC